MTARITLALLFIVPAAMAYPWQSTVDWWVLGVAVAVVVVLFAWWRGLFVTTIVGRRLAMWRRRNHTEGLHQSSTYTTVVMRVDASTATEFPLPLIAGYLDRYGVRCDKVRVTSQNRLDTRTTWISLTLSAADNLVALRARSPRMPLSDTTEVVARRLADHLRETGWDVTIVETADSPAPASAKETWRALHDQSGYVAAYRVAVDDNLAETLCAVWAHPSSETWSALETTDTGVAVMCAMRFEDRPPAGAPIPGLTPVRGRHGPALGAFNPASVDRLESRPVPFTGLTGLRWRVGRALASRT